MATVIKPCFTQRLFDDCSFRLEATTAVYKNGLREIAKKKIITGKLTVRFGAQWNPKRAVNYTYKVIKAIFRCCVLPNTRVWTGPGIRTGRRYPHRRARHVPRSYVEISPRRSYRYKQ